jgi:hypothetical protein
LFNITQDVTKLVRSINAYYGIKESELPPTPLSTETNISHKNRINKSRIAILFTILSISSLFGTMRIPPSK